MTPDAEEHPGERGREEIHDLGPTTRALELEIQERKRTEAALMWELGVNRAIADLTSLLLSEHSSIEDISDLVLKKAQEITESVHGFVGHIDPQTGDLVCSTMTRDIWSQCQVEDKDITAKQFHGLWGWVMSHCQPLLTNDASDDRRSTGIPPGHLRIGRFVAAPATIGDRLVGIVALANSKRDYAERDLNLIERLARIYAVAIQRKRMEDELYYVSVHDSLTGLYNRSFFAQELERLRRAEMSSVSILVVDVDGLKTMNDSRGHLAGDELLRRTARLLTDTFREGDVVARIGGDEFAVILPGAHRALAEQALCRLRSNLATHNASGPQPPLSISMGVATGDGTRDLAATLKEADDQMYLDKQSKNAHSMGTI